MWEESDDVLQDVLQQLIGVEDRFASCYFWCALL